MTRPIPVSIVAAFLGVATLISLVVGVALVVPGTFLDRMWVYNRPAHAAFQKLGTPASVGFLILTVVAGATAAGLSTGRRWAWWIAVLIFALNGLGDLFSFLSTHDLLRSGSGIAVAIAFLALLLRRNVRVSFGLR